MVAHKVKLRIGLKIEPRLYTFLLGKSSSRKSSTAKAVIDVFEKVDGFNIIRGVGSEIGLGKVLSQKKNLLLFQDELKQFFAKIGIKNSALLSMANQLFDDTKYDNYVKGDSSSMIVTAGHLSFLGCSTEETYQDLLTGTARDIGFDNRILLVPGESKRIGLPSLVPEDIVEKHKMKLDEIIYMINGIRAAHYDGKKYVEFDDRTFENIYQPFYIDEIETLGNENSRKRLESYTLRLAVLLALTQKKHIIDDITMEKTIGTIRWQAQVRDECNPEPVNNVCADYENRIMKYLKKHKNEAIYTSKLKYNMRHKINRTGSEPFLKAIHLLARGGTITWTDSELKNVFIYSGN